MILSNSELAAKRILSEGGWDDIESLTSFEMKDLIFSRGAYYEEIPLVGKDGRIVTQKGKAIISVSSSINDKGKKRFTAAHELGHFELHRDIAINADTYYDLCNWYQSGIHEKEANEFASELLMPSNLYKDQCIERKFEPELLQHLSDIFIVSKTAAILKFVKVGNHPICVVCTKDNRVKWWKMTKKMEEADHDFVPGWLKFKLKITTNLPPPMDSVAGQLFRRMSNSHPTERFQEIEKSTWFNTLKNDDPKMFEFCHFIPIYNFALSVIWED